MQLILTKDGLLISSFLSFFLIFFRSLGPRIDTHGSFMMVLVFLVLFWLLLFGLLMFRKYSGATLVSVFLFCPFSVKMSIKKSCFTLEMLFSTYYVYLWKKSFEYSHCDMWCYVCVWIYLYICYWCFPKDFEIIRVITSVGDSYIKKIELLVFIFKFSRVLNWWILTVQDV